MKQLKKNKNIFLLTLLMTLTLSGCEYGYNSDAKNEGAVRLNVNGVTREYIMHVPSTLDSSSAVPLMLIFHGWTMSATDQMNISDMRDLADSEKFILVYPQGTVYERATHWNVGSWTTGSTSDDLGFVDKLIGHISATHNVDTTRIYAAGYSNGGFFSHELACKLSNKVAAIGTVVANMSTRTKQNCNPSHPTPVVTISGTNDKEVSYDGTNFEGQISHNEVLNYWVRYNQTDTSPIISDMPNIDTKDGSTVKLYQYKNGKNNVEIEHYKVINGGHDWPGTFGNMDINANTIIWNFVSQFDLNGRI